MRWQKGHLRLGKWVTCDSESLATRRGHLRLGKWVTCDSRLVILPKSFFLPPCLGLHSAPLFKFTPFLPYTMPWSQLSFFNPILPLCLNFPPCVPPNNGLHSTSLFKLSPLVFHQALVSILLLYLNFPPSATAKAAGK